MVYDLSNPSGMCHCYHCDDYRSDVEWGVCGDCREIFLKKEEEFKIKAKEDFDALSTEKQLERLYDLITEGE